MNKYLQVKLENEYIQLKNKSENLQKDINIFKNNRLAFLMNVKNEIKQIRDSQLIDINSQLIRDITTQIIDVVLSNGHPNIVFNLQYTNPNKDNYRPGPPLKQLSIEEKQWLTDRGFRVQEIVECFNVSNSCEFVCHGDGVGKLRIKWEMTGSFIKDCIDLFTVLKFKTSYLRAKHIW